MKKVQGISLLVFIAAGFIIGFSYNSTQQKRPQSVVDTQQIVQQDAYREELIVQQERNKALATESDALQRSLHDYEQNVATNEQQYQDLAQQAKDLRLVLGDIASEGQGVRVTLADGDYDPATMNANEYIVHESHVLQVLNELKMSGAEALAVNGQRVTANSYIRCTGPVITIDDKQFPAPFIIEAVGDTTVLNASLNLRGGIIDQLMHDNITVNVEDDKKLFMPSVHSKS